MSSERSSFEASRIARELRQLARDEGPPDELENRVVAALGRGHHLRAAETRVRLARLAIAAAATIAIFAAGVLAGSARTSVADGPRYALLLMDGPRLPAPSPAQEAALIERHREWARSLRHERALVLAEKLGETRFAVPDGGAVAQAGDASEVSGIFVVVAASDAEARLIAESSPHAQRGGRVVVVRIDPT